MIRRLSLPGVREIRSTRRLKYLGQQEFVGLLKLEKVLHSAALVGVTQLEESDAEASNGGRYPPNISLAAPRTIPLKAISMPKNQMTS